MTPSKLRQRRHGFSIQIRMARIASLALLISGAFACFHAAPPGRAACSVTVRGRTAEIAFPQVDRAEWIWNRPATDSASKVPNYTWSLYLYPGPGVHVEVSRDAHGPEQSGDLPTMIRMARASITWPSTLYEFDDVHDAPALRPTVEHGRVVIRVSDSASFWELFELNHPTDTRCDFDVDGDTEPPWVWGVVRYIER